MQEYSIKTNVSDTYLKCYGDLKIGNKSLKQTNWFKVEPQIVSFTLLYFTKPNNDQETASNVIIDNIFSNSIINNGMVQNLIVRIYYGATIIFTGIVDIEQSDYLEIEKIASITCYDSLRMLSFLKDDDYQIINNEISSTLLASYLQSAINEYGINTFTVSNQYNLVDYTMPNPVYIPLNTRVGFGNGWGTDYYIIYFMPITDIIPLPDQIDYATFYFGMIHIKYYPGYYDNNLSDVALETVVYRIDGLTFSEKFRAYRHVALTQGYFANVNSINNLRLEARLAVYDVIGLVPEQFPYGYQYEYEITEPFTFNGLIYQVTEPTGNLTDYKLEVTGNPFSTSHVFGDYLENGYSEESKTGIIDVMKMMLKVNNMICFADNIGIITLRAYKDYATTTILDDDDIINIKRNYTAKQIIDSIDGLDSDYSTWLVELNRYYASNLNSITKSVNIIKEGNENIKIGDRVTNSTRGLDLFILKYDYNIDKPYFTVTGVSI